MSKAARETPGSDSRAASSPDLEYFEDPLEPQEHQTEWADYLLDPETYLDQLEDVEATVVSMFADVPYLLSSSPEGDPQRDPQHESLATIRLLKTVSHAFRYLQSIGFCGAEFNIIVKNSQYDRLEIVPIDGTIIALLLGTISREEWSHSTTDDMLQHLGIVPIDLLRYSGSVPVPGSLFGGSSGWLIAKILALGLMSYSGSHISNFLDRLASTQWSLPSPLMNSSGLSGMTYEIVLDRVLLSCLDEFVGAPVWAFSLRLNGREEPSGVRYKLLTSLRSLADLWGPTNAVYTDERCELLTRIDVERGTIIATGDTLVVKYDTRLLVQPEYISIVPCHWYKWSREVPRPHVTFSEESMLLIDGIEDVQAESSSTAASGPSTNSQSQTLQASMSSFGSINALELHENRNCRRPSQETGTLLRNNGHHVGLGSSDRRWLLDTVSFGAGFSKLVTGGASLTLKRGDGVSYKAITRISWDGDQPKVDTLDVRLIVEISACTGNARRITFLELFQLPNVRTYVYTNNNETKASKIRFFEAADLDFKIFKEAWDDPSFRITATKIIRQVYHELDQTEPGKASMMWFAGVEPDGYLLIGKHQYEWTALLANSPHEAALLVLSSRCLQQGSALSSCDNPDDSRNTGLRTTLALTKKTPRSLRHFFYPSLSSLANQHKEIKKSSHDEQRQRNLLRTLSRIPSTSSALSPHSALGNPRRARIQLSSSIEGAPRHADESAEMGTRFRPEFYREPLLARLNTDNGHKTLSLPYKNMPKDGVQHIQIDDSWTSLYDRGFRYREFIRGQRDQLDMSDTVEVWIT